MPMLNPAYQQTTNTWIEIPAPEIEIDDGMQNAIDELMEGREDFFEEDAASIKDGLIFEPTGYPVEVYIIAHSNSGRGNMCQKIPCKKVKPLGNWCYDLNTDMFLIDCAGYAHLGRFPIGYKMRMEGVEGWSANVPLSESVIEKRISGPAKKLLEDFKKDYPKDKNSYSFVQCSGVFRNGQEF